MLELKHAHILAAQLTENLYLQPTTVVDLALQTVMYALAPQSVQHVLVLKIMEPKTIN